MDDGVEIRAELDATPGGVVSLNRAPCRNCAVTYPGPFRVSPRAMTKRTCHVHARPVLQVGGDRREQGLPGSGPGRGTPTRGPD